MTFRPAMRAAAGNTSATTVTLGGTLVLATSTAVLAKSTNTLAVGSGAAFDIYYDGGSTPTMTGVVPAPGTPVVLTGAAFGATATWSVGTSVTGDTWKATCAVWGDTSDLGNDWISPTAASDPIITPGINGKCGLLGDGTSTTMASQLSLPSTSVAAVVYQRILLRISTWQSGRRITDGDTSGNSRSLLMSGVSPTLEMHWNGGFTSNTLAVSAFARIEQLFTGSAAATWPNNDTFKLGSATTVLGSVGNGNGSSGRRLFSGASGSTRSAPEILGVMICMVSPSVAQRATLDAMTTVWSAGGVQV